MKDRILDDSEVQQAIITLKSKGITFEQIKEVYQFYNNMETLKRMLANEKGEGQ